MKFLAFFMIFASLSACTMTYNTKIDSDNNIIVRTYDPVVLIRDSNNPYRQK